MPLLATALAPEGRMLAVLLPVTLLALAVLGAVRRGPGERRWRTVRRVLLWGIFAMGVTGVIGRLVGVSAWPQPLTRRPQGRRSLP